MKLLIVCALAVVVVAETYGRQGRHKAPKAAAPPAYQAAVPIPIAAAHYRPQPAYYQEAAAPAKDYGPDTSNFHYQVPVYDAKTYGNADVNVNRFPGGATYQVHENVKGSNVKVNFETAPSKKQSHKPGY